MPDVFELVEKDVTEVLASRPESTVIVGLTRKGERRVEAFRSPGASHAPLPTESSIYEIGSVSKVFTTTILAELERQGALSLDDPVGKHLPSHLRLKPEIGAITIRQLATHSSGLPSMGKIHTEIAASETMGQTQPPFGAYTHYLRYKKEHLYADWENAELVYPTGENFLYCVMGMGTVGHILELVTGRPFEDLLREYICTPLGLPDTAYELSLEQVARIQRAYDSDGSPCPSWFHDVLMPQGGLRSTMNDLLTFAEAHFATDGPLTRAMARARESHLRLPEGTKWHGQVLDPPWKTELDHGLAWRRFDGRGNAVWHPGTTLFYHSGLAIDQDAQVGLVMLSTNRRTLADMGVLVAPYLNWFVGARTA